MSVGGALSAADLANIADDGTSVAMRWLDMVLPPASANNTTREEQYTLKVIEEPANKFVRLIKDPFNLISVMGPARSGKSTLMNLLAGCKKTELFATYAGMETFTKGIYVPTRVLTLPQFSSLEDEPIVEASNSNVKVSFVDTEGQGAVGDAYDMSLFSPALVTSRVVIYNRTGGLLTDEILSQLGMMAEAGRRLRAAEMPTNNQPNGTDTTPSKPLFGHLFLIFNQFRLNAKDTADSIKTLLLTDERSITSAATNRNNIRKMLRSVFESIQVFILPDKLKQEARNALSDGTKPFILLDDFEPVYLDYFKLLRTGLSKALMQPRELSPGLPLSGGSIADFMPSFAEAINKAEPLNVPSIFESAQNASINKALVDFTTGLTTNIDGLLKEEAKPTQLLSSLVDKDIALLQAVLSSTISYMAPTVVKRVQDQALATAQPMKASLLDSNLTRLKALMSSALTAAVASIDTEAKAKFPESNLLLSTDDIQNRFAAISTQILGGYKSKGESYDVKAFPEGYAKTLQDALDAQKNTISSKVDNAWRVWVLDVNQTQLRVLTDALIKLGANTKVGDTKIYLSAVSSLMLDSQMEFEKKVEAEYKGADREGQKKTFAAAAENAAKMQQALWEQNDAEVKKQAADLLTELKLKYSMQLQDALVPHVEPIAYSQIVNAVMLRDQLIAFGRDNKVADSITNALVFQFDAYVSSQKNAFNTTYQQACADYGTYLSAELTRSVPLILSSFNSLLDAIDLSVNLATTTKVKITTDCDSYARDARNKYELLLTRLMIQSDGVVSKSIVETFRDQLEDGLKIGKTTKLGKYDEVVSGYNKALLTSIVVPVIDQTLANKFATKVALADEVAKAQRDFMTRSTGDGTDATTKWSDFYNSTYKALEECVDRNNAYKVPSLEGNFPATKEIQLYVIKNIWRNCADMANCLKMSYINSAQFDDDSIQDMGTTRPDPTDPSRAEQTTRWFRMNNKFSETDKYKWDRKTNLEFFDWTVETSDIIWGKPIITDLKPSKLDTIEYGAQSTPITVTVGNISTESSTVTDSKTWGISGGIEASYKWGGKASAPGLETTWETLLKATFNGKFDSTHTDQLMTTYTTSTSAQIILPPNRINCINQMVFNQRTSLPYTAKVRVVPKLRFQNGFTAWGGGGSYRDNPNTGALKDNFKDGDRTFRDFEFSRCDEIRDDARGDSDPWMWKLAMQRQPFLVALLDSLADGKPYEVYVKGKWEGITGKYAVTTVTPKSTNLTLMPNF